MASQGEVRTTCPYCGVGCGVAVSARPDGALSVRGDARHPANRGRLCSKGSALAETVGLDGRLLEPRIGDRPVAWEQALEAVARGFERAIRAHGPESVAFYVSGQLLTEDYYVANKLMKGYIGASNIDTNSRLCMASSVAGYQRAFGGDIVPGNYEDLEQAELVVLVGSNLAWCHPVLYQRIQHARKTQMHSRIVVIDPRRTATCDGADLHLALRPGTDTVLFNGLLVYLDQHDRTDAPYLARHTEGYAEALRAARSVAPDTAAVARRCGLAEVQVTAFYALFAATERTVTVYSQGVNQSSFGTDKVNAILNCHLATGRIGRPGMGPFSVTGQPNAMGGREVGGLASQLAAHMDFSPENLDRVGRFWNAPRMTRGPGLKAVELFEAVRGGRIKALWIMGTNPVVSLPEADAVRTALERCEWVVVSDVVDDTDTARLAHVLLPALAWGEKDGTVTNSERRISRQRPFLPAPGAARADWWIASQVARRMGFGEHFAYRTPADIFREHAALSAFENDGRRAFDIGGLAALSDAEYEALAPMQWPLPAASCEGTARLLGAGRFYTPSGRGRLIAVGERRPVHTVDAEYPLVLNTGRVRDQWHTMTRTGRSPRLSGHLPEPYAELHPEDAAARGIADGSLVRVASRWGSVRVRARLSEDQQPGTVFVPMHWGHPYAGFGRIDAAVNPAVDPVSGQPESKHTPVEVMPFRPAWQGFLLTRRPMSSQALADLSYWVSVRGGAFQRYELAGERRPADWGRWGQDLTGLAEASDLECIDYRDEAAGRYRGAGIRDGRLEYCLFVASTHELPPRDWLTELFAQERLDYGERLRLLSGRPGRGEADAGRTVCACFGVGLNTLVEAIGSQALATPEAVGAALRAGTHCGSCVPELRALIAQVRAGRAA